MEEIKKSRRRRKRKGRSHGFRRRKFWIRILLYFVYFSAIFLALYYLFDKKEMLKSIQKDPDIFCWKVFGTSFLFAIGLAAWMWRDPKLTGK